MNLRTSNWILRMIYKLTLTVYETSSHISKQISLNVVLTLNLTLTFCSSSPPFFWNDDLFLMVNLVQLTVMVTLNLTLNLLETFCETFYFSLNGTSPNLTSNLTLKNFCFSSQPFCKIFLNDVQILMLTLMMIWSSFCLTLAFVHLTLTLKNFLF